MASKNIFWEEVAMKEKSAVKEGSFGTYLRSKRLELGLTQNDLAERTGMDRAYLSILESEKSNPQFNKVLQLIEALGIKIDQFFAEHIQEAPVPNILVNFGAGEEDKKYKEMLIRDSLKPIPIVKNINALQSKVITADDIDGYLAMPATTIKGLSATSKLAAYYHNPASPEDFVILDLGDTDIKTGHEYLIYHEGEPATYKAHVKNNGYYFLRIHSNEESMFSALGKQKEHLKVLGRVVKACSVV